MNNVNFIREVAKKTGYAQSVVREIICGSKEVIMDKLPTEDKISVFAGINFKTITRNARVCRNPKTGESINVPEKTIPKVTFSAAIKQAVNDFNKGEN